MKLFRFDLLEGRSCLLLRQSESQMLLMGNKLESSETLPVLKCGVWCECRPGHAALPEYIGVHGRVDVAGELSETNLVHMKHELWVGYGAKYLSRRRRTTRLIERTGACKCCQCVSGGSACPFRVDGF